MKQRLVTVLIVLAAAGMLAAGMLLGEPAQVQQKAVNICLECIGIG